MIADGGDSLWRLPFGLVEGKELLHGLRICVCVPAMAIAFSVFWLEKSPAPVLCLSSLYAPRSPGFAQSVEGSRVIGVVVAVLMIVLPGASRTLFVPVEHVHGVGRWNSYCSTHHTRPEQACYMLSYAQVVIVVFLSSLLSVGDNGFWDESTTWCYGNLRPIHGLMAKAGEAQTALDADLVWSRLDKREPAVSEDLATQGRVNQAFPLIDLIGPISHWV